MEAEEHPVGHRPRPGRRGARRRSGPQAVGVGGRPLIRASLTKFAAVTSQPSLSTVRSALGEDGVRTVALNRPGAPERHEPPTHRRRGERLRPGQRRRRAPGPSSSPAPAARSAPATTARTTPNRRARPRPATWSRPSSGPPRPSSSGAKPVVGAINGWAVGGGFEWAINCDFPIWAESARGFFPEVSLNIFVTGAVTSLLPALVGLNAAREMLFLGEQYDAAAPARARRGLAGRARRAAAGRGATRWRPGWPPCRRWRRGR